MRITQTFALVLVLASPAAIAAPDGAGPSVTIYQRGQGVVSEARRVELTAGRQGVELTGLPLQIRPETVMISVEGASVMGLSYDAEPFSAASLARSAASKPVRIVRTPATGPATVDSGTLLALDGMNAIVQLADHIEVAPLTSAWERVLLPNPDPPPHTSPRLLVDLDASRAGPRTLELQYLTGGLTWHADYAAQFDEAAETLDLTGRISVANTAGALIVDASLNLAAGDVAMASAGRLYRPQAMAFAAAPAPPPPQMESVGELHIYRLPGRWTLADGETRQIPFMTAIRVPAHKILRWTAEGFGSSEEPQHARALVSVTTRSTTGFEDGLPAGTMRIFQKDSLGRETFVGERSIGDLPRGAQVTIDLGGSFDVTVKPTLVSATAVGKRRVRYVMSYEVKNAKPAPVTVELRQAGLEGATKVWSESIAGKSIDATTRGWTVPVAGGGEVTLTADLETMGQP